jgi:dTDP-4-dehydrorhamnose reductase
MKFDLSKTPPSILIVGSDGQIGRTLLDRFSVSGWSVVGTSRRSDQQRGVDRIFLDLSLPPSDWTEIPVTEIAVICASVVSIADCEKDPEHSWAINVDRTTDLVRKLTDNGTYTILLSTVGVFDSRSPFRRSDETPHPITIYGKQKLEAERRLLELDSRSAVLRLTKFAHKDMPLVAHWKRAIENGEQITAFVDSTFSPIDELFIFNLIKELSIKKLSGIFHASADANLPYIELARRLVDALGANRDCINEESAESTAKNFSTVFNSLDMSVEKDKLGIGPVSAIGVIDKVVNDLSIQK